MTQQRKTKQQTKRPSRPQARNPIPPEQLSKDFGGPRVVDVATSLAVAKAIKAERHQCFASGQKALIYDQVDFYCEGTLANYIGDPATDRVPATHAPAIHHGWCLKDGKIVDTMGYHRWLPQGVEDGWLLEWIARDIYVPLLMIDLREWVDGVMAGWIYAKRRWQAILPRDLLGAAAQYNDDWEYLTD